MAQSGPVFVVDDDAGARDSLAMLLESSGYAAQCYESAVAFLASRAPDARGCLIADVQMPDMNGLQLQNELAARRSPLSVIVVTGHGDIPVAVQAMKAGAVDFLEKPFEETVLLDSVRRALERATSAGRQDDAAKDARRRLTQLTERERQVLDLIVTGKANKVIAYELSISPRTVEIHRARVMDKMGAANLAELVRKVLSLTA
ncbi:MAG: response regulator transcription factor [Alphaproteobacteria bacterium]|nr:response regulator transcription factor [Alphaproteobacteria bacterium]MDE2631098.1 response regulator transcription factor [Alphaproteobacteria bacterium]